MRHGTLLAIVALVAGFWGLVFWAADAFSALEVGGVVGAILLIGGGWLAWEVRHAAVDPHEPDEFYVPDEWLWPPAEDRSTVRHGGLGR